MIKFLNLLKVLRELLDANGLVINNIFLMAMVHSSQTIATDLAGKLTSGIISNKFERTTVFVAGWSRRGLHLLNDKFIRINIHADKDIIS